MASAGIRIGSILISTPPSSRFTFPPSNEPITLPAPTAGSSLTAPPFTIPEDIYNQALDVRVPITIATIYAITVVLVNRYNRANGNKAWPISKTRPFFWFVVAHNVFLAVYSAWTFVGIFGALKETFLSWNGPEGVAGMVDSLCKMHGPRGLGNAVTYNSTLSAWSSPSSAIRLSATGTPDSTDLGRLWNQGLAFYGWFFYLSKFYEVLDTAIILAKGKRSQTLQTYHHAGAMMCMWAGIRYMSPPIWMFVCVNSAIHAMMYTYYTLTAFSVRVPQAIKRSLTTMQIIQFLVGATYASLHSFVYYDIPILVPTTMITSAASAASSAVSSAAAVATSAGVIPLLKKFLFRAVGEEGLAENAGTYYTEQLSRLKESHGIPQTAQYHTEYQTTACIDTEGQTFAIWLNVFYLTPLTFLFARFFYKSYIRRSPKSNQKVNGASGASQDAIKGMERKLLGEQPNGVENGYVKTNGHANSNGHTKTNGNTNGKVL